MILKGLHSSDKDYARVTGFSGRGLHFRNSNNVAMK